MANSKQLNENMLQKKTHILRQSSFYIPTYCDRCQEFIFGFGKTGMKCELCYRAFHKTCAHEVYLQECSYFQSRGPQKLLKKGFSLDESESTTTETKNNVSFQMSDTLAGTSSTNSNNLKEDFLPNFEEDNTVKKYETKYKKNKTNLVVLQRMSQKIRKTNDLFWKGHMIYSKNTDMQIYTHYWTLDNKKINVYETWKLNKKLFDISLESIIRASTWSNSDELRYKKNSEHIPLYYIEIPKCVIFCGLDNVPSHPLNQTTRNFYNIFKIVFLPYNTFKGRSKLVKISAPEYSNSDISSIFLMDSNDILGSGQFGQVIGGVCKKTKRQVAIKVIDKAKVDENKTETSYFQNEATILFNFKHPGLLELIALFDDTNFLYIVTEKLSIDLLTKIEQSKSGSLSESLTKFIIYQILIALVSLHERNIAHCDLKPENILLVRDCELPQVKICDFGYSKIIGESSFRRSIVGTPAYSPPEVREARTFNKSMDMWSMGVITYVCLSGFFPFNDDDDIYEQIRNANFMFPEEYWHNVSNLAINIIESEFLQLSLNKRGTARRTLSHKWFTNDYELYLNLKELENQANEKWLFDEEQEKKWISLKQEPLKTYL